MVLIFFLHEHLPPSKEYNYLWMLRFLQEGCPHARVEVAVTVAPLSGLHKSPIIQTTNNFKHVVNKYTVQTFFLIKYMSLIHK